MRFRPWPKPTAFEATARKRSAFLRKQRLEREALPLFADEIGARQHSVDDEMIRRAEAWDRWERRSRAQRAAAWRAARKRLFACDGTRRALIRRIWRNCPYPADPASFADFLHQIAIGRLDPRRPPWIFHAQIAPRITPNPATFAEAFRPIGRKPLRNDQGADIGNERLFCGNLGGGLLFVAIRVTRGAPQPHIDVQVRGACADDERAFIHRLASAHYGAPDLPPGGPEIE